MQTCTTIKKEKFREQEKEIFSSVLYCRNLEFTPSKVDKLQMFLRVLPQKEKALQGKTGTSQPYKFGKLQIRSGKDLFVHNLNGGLEICWTLQKQV